MTLLSILNQRDTSSYSRNNMRMAAGLAGAVPVRLGNTLKAPAPLLDPGRQPQQDDLDVLSQIVHVCLEPYNRTLAEYKNLREEIKGYASVALRVTRRLRHVKLTLSDPPDQDAAPSELTHKRRRRLVRRLHAGVHVCRP